MKNQVNNTRENLNKIKIDSIRLEILYRSLYILKKKFEKFKKEIKSIYIKYYPEENKSLSEYDFPITKIINFFPLLQEVLEKIKITIPRINDLKEIFNYDISKFDKNSKEHLESIKLMEKILFEKNKINLEKYNKKFYTKKIEPIVDYFLMKGNGEDLTEIKCITEYDRKGRIINTFGKLLENIGIKSNFKLITKNPKDEYDNNIEKGDILYIEVLPIILADFLQENNDFVVIDLDTEDKKFLSDIKKRFDDNLLQKINNGNNFNIFKTYASNKNNNSIKNGEKKILSPEERKKLCENKKYKLEKNIKFYQNLLLTKKNKGESYKYIIDFISKMEQEKERLEKELKELTLKINAIILEEQKVERKKEKKLKSPEEKLHEIFRFYCSQHKAQSPFPTFDQIEFKGNHMNISEFCKFCKEFKIPISLDKLMEIYNKRNPLLDKVEIDFNEFIIILEKISLLMNEYKINKYKKKIEKLNKKTKGLKVSSDSDEEINNNSDIKILSSKTAQYKKNIEYLKTLNNTQMFNELKKFLEIDKPKKFRDKMKGFLFKFWDDTEKIERFPALTNDEYQRVKKQVKIFKSMREKSAKEKEYKNEKLKEELYNKKKEEFINNNKKLVKKIKDKEEKKSYILLKNFHIKKKKQRNEFNLDLIKSNTYEGIANSNLDLNQEEKEQLFIQDEEDNSDDEIFKKYDPNKKDENKEEKAEVIINLKNKEDLNNIGENNNNKDNNNSRNVMNSNDNLSSINTSHTNATFEINALKMNLKPKKKDNIYFSSNNIIGISDITEEMKEKETEKKPEDSIIINLDVNNSHNTIDANNHNNKKNDIRYQEMYGNTPRFNNNDFKNRLNPININNYNNQKKSIGINKNKNKSKDNYSLINNNNINKKENKLSNLEDSYKKEKEKIRLINNSVDFSNKKYRVNTLDNQNIIDNNNNNPSNNVNSEPVKSKNNIQKIIQLPPLNISNINTFGINNETNRATAHFKESKASNIVNTQPNNNNIIVLPSINNQRYNLLYNNQNQKSTSNQKIKKNSFIKLNKDNNI